jgi:hypothetical protein
MGVVPVVTGLVVQAEHALVPLETICLVEDLALPCGPLSVWGLLVNSLGERMLESRLVLCHKLGSRPEC